jgi:beta-glucuronidase
MMKNSQTFLKAWILMFVLADIITGTLYAQTAMQNIEGRNTISLNGRWTVILDPTGSGDWRQVWQEKVAQKKTDFVEYSFDGGPKLTVPGDFNSQLCELTYVEGTVWYKKTFSYKVREGKRLFIHFGAVNYFADVYLNGTKIGSHEGGFTPFQFEITDKVKAGDNTVIVRANNTRLGNGLPGFGYDWFNYGGITREVALVETNSTFIEDYSIQLKKGSRTNVSGWIQLNGAHAGQNVEIEIPELRLTQKAKVKDNGMAMVDFSSRLQLWSPNNPKLYKVVIRSKADTVVDNIGFRSIEVKRNQILLNGTPIFLKAVNIHEENPYKSARAYSAEDARLLLSAAKDLGCNLVRLAHYPHNENMIREAERMGLMVWDELPAYQHIQFSDSLLPGKLNTMMQEMIRRDRNRCAVIVWCLSNETYPGTPGRNDVLVDLTRKCRSLDSTRIVTHVINTQSYEDNSFRVSDPLYEHSDLIAINEYIGWYIPWQGKPSEVKWQISFPDKPVFISEFGGEALYGNKNVPIDEAASWSEEYQEKIYKDQIEMFNTVPNLVGVCPWLLFDYRSLVRMNQMYQNGYNRKGLLSENGEKKKAWFVMNEYFQQK